MQSKFAEKSRVSMRMSALLCSEVNMKLFSEEDANSLITVP